MRQANKMLPSLKRTASNSPEKCMGMEWKEDEDFPFFGG